MTNGAERERARVRGFPRPRERRGEGDEGERVAGLGITRNVSMGSHIAMDASRGELAVSV